MLGGRIALAAVLLVMAGCTGPTSTPANEVRAEAASFAPRELSIPAGEAVTWRVTSDNHHTVTIAHPNGTAGAALADSEDLAPGATFSFEFEGAGTYHIYCRYHSQGAQGVYDPAEMTMTVTVT